MIFRYLGTAAAEGWPALFCTCRACREAKADGGKSIRSRSQAVIDDVLLLDLPPDTYMHTYRSGLDTTKIRDILITHTHEDHLYLEDIMVTRQPGYSEYETDFVLRVHGNDALARRAESWRGNPSTRLDEVTKHCTFAEQTEFAPFRAGAYTVTALLADHNKREKCFFYLIEKDGKAVLYAHDTGYFPEASWAHLAGKKLDFVSLDCTHGMSECRRNHMGIPCCAEVRARLLAEGIATEKTVFVLNHFSHNGDEAAVYNVMAERAAAYGFLVSYDGMEIEF